MSADERRKTIRQQVLSQGRVRIADLIQEFQVSEETIRRDLSILEAEGLVKRNYGGAVLDEFHENVPPVHQRESIYFEEKNEIGKKAAELVGANQIVILDAGTTTWCVARHLRSVPDLTIVTNGINVAEECSKNDRASIYVVGGMLFKRAMSLVGPKVQEELQHYSASYVFLGTTGISLQKGFMTSDLYEAEAKRAMLKAGHKVVIVADHSKFEKHGLTSFAAFEEVDLLITSDRADSGILREIEKLGVEVIVCSTHFLQSS